MTTARLTLRLSPMKACAMSRILPRIMLLISSGENRFFSPLKVTAHAGADVMTLLFLFAAVAVPHQSVHVLCVLPRSGMLKAFRIKALALEYCCQAL